MIKNHLKLSFISILFLSVPAAWALTPPLPPEQLQKDADLVVEGEVESPIKCQGSVSRNKCYNEVKFTVPLKVRKVLKGEATVSQSIPVTFFYYDYGKSGCVGDQAAVLRSGDQGKYYLKKLPDGSFTPLHWSAAQVTVRGPGYLPKCP